MDSEIIIAPVRPKPSKENWVRDNRVASVAYLVIVLWGIHVSGALLIPLCLAALLALLMAPIVRALSARRVPDWISILLACLILLLPFVFIGWSVVREMQSFLQDYPRIIGMVQTWMHNAAASPWAEKYGLSEKLSASGLSEQLTQRAGEGLQLLLGTLRTFFEAGTQLALVFVFSILMLASRQELRHAGERILERFESIHAEKMLDEVTTLIEKFLLTKLIVVAIVSVSSLLALMLLGLKYSLLLGLTVGVLTFLPEVGFVVSLGPVVLVALVTGHSGLSTLGILGAMVVVHLVEANLLTPKLVGERLNLNVLSTFVGLFAGGLFWGVWGMLLSVPVMGVLRILLSASPEYEAWGLLLVEKEQTGINALSFLLRRGKPDSTT